ncbi:hypothetical protein F5879DRAFT_994074 [Lentinula edodes]|nr:hypothetical protein F5879DRAFT_994074 [Lentinula edodes]
MGDVTGTVATGLETFPVPCAEESITDSSSRHHPNTISSPLPPSPLPPSPLPPSPLPPSPLPPSPLPPSPDKPVLPSAPKSTDDQMEIDEVAGVLDRNPRPT